MIRSHRFISVYEA